ncbi:hypothetical protein [Nocardia cyriacigeorgica]|uniref:hypothetical protein n=1 Tax=Nocardia cyriacigeorgica TaxID=135487 RepID=UPI0024558425|nr:hypothetical protein [Nocardia cyriacigeorgica]
MSEYQYYEFLAVDRPLDDDEQAAVRSLSTRARITATSFVNEYHWGNFKGSPRRLMEQVYDAHLYVANWGTHRVMFRLPCDLLDPGVVEGYCVGDGVDAWVSGEFVILDFASEDEAGEFDFDYDPAALLSAIIGVRAELAAGDLRPLYLAGLAACGAWEREEDLFDRDADNDLEPPVPPGLGSLTASQRALADFLRIDADLLAVAAQASAPLEQSSDDLEDLPGLADPPAGCRERPVPGSGCAGGGRTGADGVAAPLPRRGNCGRPRPYPPDGGRPARQRGPATGRARAPGGRETGRSASASRTRSERCPGTTTRQTSRHTRPRLVARRGHDRHPKTSRIRCRHHTAELAAPAAQRPIASSPSQMRRAG